MKPLNLTADEVHMLLTLFRRIEAPYFTSPGQDEQLHRIEVLSNRLQPVKNKLEELDDYVPIIIEVV